MKCPACDGFLTPTDVNGVEVDFCASCRGVWFDKAELERLMELAEDGESDEPDWSELLDRTRVEPFRVVYRKCPRCAGLMARKNYRHVSGVIVDLCPQHGLWLDRGEFARIVSFENAGGDDKERRFLEREREHLEDVARSMHTPKLSRPVNFTLIGHHLLDLF